MTEADSSRGQLVYDPRITWALVIAAFTIGGLAFYSASLQHGSQGVIASVVGLAFVSVGVFVVRDRNTVRLRWDASGLEAPGNWWSSGDGTAARPGVIRIGWDQVSWLGPDNDLRVIDGKAGQRIAVDIEFCRGRRRLVAEMRARRPDLFPSD